MCISHTPLTASSYTTMAPVAYFHAPADSAIMPQFCLAHHCPQTCAHAFPFALRLIAYCQALRVTFLLFSHVLWFCRFLTPIAFCFWFWFLFVVWLACLLLLLLLYCIFWSVKKAGLELESWVKLVTIEKCYSDIEFRWGSCMERDSRKVNMIKD